MNDMEAFEAWHDDKNRPYPNGHECPHRYWERQAWQAALAYERAKRAEPIAIVVDNNQPGWRNIVVTDPNVTLDVGMKLYAAPTAVQAEPVALHIDDAECVMYAALRAAHERGPVSDDKVLLDELAKRGVYLCRAAPPAVQVAWPKGLRDRLRAAHERIINGHAPRRIPADPTDADLVLAEVRNLLDGNEPPFWVAGLPREPLYTAPPAVQQQVEPVANLHDNKTAVTEPHPMLSAGDV